jgi:hypothetical protein
VLAKSDERAMYVTFLASAFRTLRFGLGESHARGMALQVNWLLDRRAVRVAPDGTFAVDFARIRPAVEALTREIMTIQATGDYARAKAWMAREVVIRPQVRQVLSRLEGVPVDIRPRFVTAEKLLADAQGRR